MIMMNVYMISYDLKVPGRDYTSLYEKIKSLGDWQHPLESVWLLATSEYNEDSIYQELKPVLDANDLLLILKVNPINRQGWLAVSFWKWMEKYSNQ